MSKKFELSLAGATNILRKIRSDESCGFMSYIYMFAVINATSYNLHNIILA
jgi:hypothetical protein